MSRSGQWESQRLNDGYRRSMTPDLSIVILQWERDDLTRACVESLRAGTRTSHEIIIVDNGSRAAAADAARELADVAVLNEVNLGFAAGMNAGLAAASGGVIAFVNNDTRFPNEWDVPLVEHFKDSSVGLVAPAVTEAGNPVTVRSTPGSEVIRLLPFGEFPSGVVYLVRTAQIRALDGWNESYPIASSEDLDLCFTYWANGLDIVLDTRVLVDHVGQASVRQLEDHHDLYAANLRLFLSRWGGETNDVPRLETVDHAAHQANLARARTAIRWIERMLEAREEARRLRKALDRQHDTAVRPTRPGWTRKLLRYLSGLAR